jgi:hypothetical protein
MCWVHEATAQVGSWVDLLAFVGFVEALVYRVYTSLYDSTVQLQDVSGCVANRLSFLCLLSMALTCFGISRRACNNHTDRGGKSSNELITGRPVSAW